MASAAHADDGAPRQWSAGRPEAPVKASGYATTGNLRWRPGRTTAEPARINPDSPPKPIADAPATQAFKRSTKSETIVRTQAQMETDSLPLRAASLPQGASQFRAPRLLAAAQAPLDADPSPSDTRLRQVPTPTLNLDSGLGDIGDNASKLDVDCAAERSKLKTINAITTNIKAQSGDFPPECDLDGGMFQARDWCNLTWTWKATNLCHKPLYFEQVQLERHGHTLPGPLQPFYSAGHFFVSAAFLPYKMGIHHPNECIYALGYYRPGSCAPYHVPGIPLSIRGAIYEAAAVGGFAALLAQ